MIAPKAFARGINALSLLKERARSFAVSEYIVVATSAVRSARNRREFVLTALRDTGLEIRVLTGIREAALIAEGVRNTLPAKFGTALVMDIGGGSVEFIIADPDRIYWRQSFDLGAARLSGNFRFSDPIRTPERKIMTAHFEKELKPLFSALEQFPVGKLVSASGSAESFARMVGHRTIGRDPLKGRRLYNIPMREYLSLHKELLQSVGEQRAKMRGLNRMRVDMIVPATILTEFILRRCGIREFFVSTFALKEGVAASLSRGERI
jgi:exopolyphosphatase/guanosine-5'-triphosphate,3'-diphosphate pyrophosphatase